MAYQAQGLGGIGGSGVRAQQNTGIDVTGLVDSVANAFRLNREGVVQRAIMQEQNRRANEANARANAEFDLATRRQKTQEQGQMADLVSHGYEDVTDVPVPLGSAGQPQTMVELGGRKFRLNPKNTPKAVERRQKIEGLIRAGVPAAQADAAADNPGLADNILFPKPTVPYEYTKEGQEAKVGLAKRLAPYTHPDRREAADAKDESARRKYVADKIADLMKPRKGPGKYDKTQPGLSLDEATRQANAMWDAASGNAPSAAPSTPARLGQPSAPPKPPQTAPGEAESYQEAAALYQKALQRPGADTEAIRKAYDAAVMDIAKRYGRVAGDVTL